MELALEGGMEVVYGLVEPFWAPKRKSCSHIIGDSEFVDGASHSPGGTVCE
jgi:hypothetical protein